MAVNSFTPVVPSYYPTVEAIAQMSLTASSGDTVNLFTLPAGFVVTGIRVDYVGTASSTIEVGDSGSATRFIGSTSTASSGSISMNATTAATSGVITAGPGYQYASGGTVTATIGGANVSASQYTFHLSGYINLAV